MQSSEIRDKFLKFFAERGHAIVPSSSLIPDDKSVLLTTAGMQQFKPYLTGKADPIQDFGGKNVFSIQKCFRTDDIDEVGDFSHLTFFEMVGNFSFGGYFKETAIPLSFEFLTSSEGMGIPPNKIFVTAFEGDDTVRRDDEAITLWQEQFRKAGMDAKLGERIFLYGRKKNWWEAGPGPSGPDAEMFYDLGTPHDPKFGPACHPNCDCGRFMEIGNDVFVQYNKTNEGAYEPLAQKSIDNGRGFERLVMVAQGKKNVFETDLFAPLMALLPAGLDERYKRMIADHLRAAVFLLADGVRPSNKEAGYVLRRLIRRALAHEHIRQISPQIFESMLLAVITHYGVFYPQLASGKNDIVNEYCQERDRFTKAFKQGLKEFERRVMTREPQDRHGRIGSFHDQQRLYGDDAFYLYQTFGFPREVMRDLCSDAGGSFDDEGFNAALKRHQEISRAGVTAKFGGHGLYLKTGEVTIRNESEVERVTRLHTATHLLHAGLRAVLGPEVRQDGSDITVERTRFDFKFGRKVLPEELKKVEDWVNEAVRRDLKVERKELAYEEAVAQGALGFFKEKYPPRVKVYSMFDASTGEVLSREFCGGPHVTHTAEIGTFKIVKEEASSAGVRRIRGVLTE